MKISICLRSKDSKPPKHRKSIAAYNFQNGLLGLSTNLGPERIYRPENPKLFQARKV